jgi:hypothetical protein
MISPLDQPGHWPMQHSSKSNTRNSHIDWCNLRQELSLPKQNTKQHFNS